MLYLYRKAWQNTNSFFLVARDLGHRTGDDLDRKVLFVGYCLPQPNNRTVGTWALSQLQAMSRAGANLLNLRLAPWMPPLIRGRRPGRRIADAPPRHRWDNVVVEYSLYCFNRKWRDGLLA